MWPGGYAMKRLGTLIITAILLIAHSGVAAVSAVETNAGDISVPYFSFRPIKGYSRIR